MRKLKFERLTQAHIRMERRFLSDSDSGTFPLKLQHPDRHSRAARSASIFGTDIFAHEFLLDEADPSKCFLCARCGRCNLCCVVGIARALAAWIFDKW